MKWKKFMVLVLVICSHDKNIIYGGINISDYTWLQGIIRKTVKPLLILIADLDKQPRIQSNGILDHLPKFCFNDDYDGNTRI